MDVGISFLYISKMCAAAWSREEPGRVSLLLGVNLGMRVYRSCFKKSAEKRGWDIMQGTGEWECIFVLLMLDMCLRFAMEIALVIVAASVVAFVLS